MKYRPFLIPIYWFAIGVIVFLLTQCYLDKDLSSVKPIPAETKRINILYGDSLESEQYRIESEKWQALYKCLKTDLGAATTKDKQATEKARYSADAFVKTPTIDNCSVALSDCQQETSTKAYSIAIQDKMLVLADSLHRIDGAEIARVNSVKDSLSDGWKKANEAFRKASKKKPWGIGIQAGYGATREGIRPCVSVGISYNFKQF